MQYPEFGKGVFTLSDGQQIEIQKLTLYNDGLVVDTRHSTEAGDSFLADLIAFSVGGFRLSSDPVTKAGKRYLSDVEVGTNSILDVLNDRGKQFMRLVIDATKLDFHEFGMRIGTDPAAHGTAVMFAFERKAGVPFGQNRYWSQAPLSTKDHLGLLDKLETILG
jgi:hypothetical protein